MHSSVLQTHRVCLQVFRVPPVYAPIYIIMSVCSVVAVPDGASTVADFVSSSGDRTLRVWKGSTLRAFFPRLAVDVLRRKQVRSDVDSSRSVGLVLRRIVKRRHCHGIEACISFTN